MPVQVHCNCRIRSRRHLTWRLAKLCEAATYPDYPEDGTLTCTLYALVQNRVILHGNVTKSEPHFTSPAQIQVTNAGIVCDRQFDNTHVWRQVESRCGDATDCPTQSRVAGVHFTACLPKRWAPDTDVRQAMDSAWPSWSLNDGLK